MYLSEQGIFTADYQEIRKVERMEEDELMEEDMEEKTECVYWNCDKEATEQCTHCEEMVCADHVVSLYPWFCRCEEAWFCNGLSVSEKLACRLVGFLCH